MSEFHGSHHDPALDHDRLEKQMGRVLDAVRDGVPRTLDEIAAEILTRFDVHDSHTSISAQCGNLRKEANGSHIIETRARVGAPRGTFERIYRGQATGGQRFWHVTCLRIVGVGRHEFVHRTVEGSRPVDAARAAMLVLGTETDVIPYGFRRWDAVASLWGPDEAFSWVQYGREFPAPPPPRDVPASGP